MTKRNESINIVGLCMAIGMVIGGAIGLLVNNLVLFAGGGLVLGFAVGASLDRSRSAIDA